MADLVREAMNTSFYWEEAHRAMHAMQVLQTSETRILWALTENGWLTRRDLQDLLVLEQSTVHRQVKHCEKNGLIESAQGDRAQEFTITDKGRRLYEETLAINHRLYSAGIAAIPDGQREQFFANLDRYVEGLRQAASQD